MVMVMVMIWKCQEVSERNLAEFWKIEAVFCLCCGWFTFPLVFIQMWSTSCGEQILWDTGTMPAT